MLSGQCFTYTCMFLLLCVSIVEPICCLLFLGCLEIIVVCINLVLLIVFSFKKKNRKANKPNILGALWMLNKKIQVTDSGIEKEWVGVEEAACIIWELSGLEVAHGSVCAFTWSLFFSGLCLATWT